MKRVQLLMTTALVLALFTTAFAGHGECTASAQVCLDKMAQKLSETGWAGLEGEFDEEKGLFTITAVVAHSPAQAAGLRVNDIVFGMNGHKFSAMDEEDWAASKAERVPGKTVSYMLKRDGAKQEVEVVLASMPEDVLAAKIGTHMIDHVTVASVQ